MSPTSKRWDMFCSVVDNFGDVGVAWRLARQLADEHAIAVRLFVDDLAVLRGIAPDGAPGVDVRIGMGRRANFRRRTPTPADAVIEMFGCGLPASYLDAMAARPVQACWINLEYLSAEAWVEDSHGLASRQPQRPLTRHFFFRDTRRGLQACCASADCSRAAMRFAPTLSRSAALWRALAIDAPAAGIAHDFAVLLPQPWVAIAARRVGGKRTRDPGASCQKAWRASNSRRGQAARDGRPGKSLRRRKLMLARVPFVAQDDYDRLLWACDLNFVRGEDSLVRAQWAARPLVWQRVPPGRGRA